MKTPLILIAMLPLAGCISFGAKPPPTLLTLTSASSVPVGQNQDSATAKSITIQVPVVPQSLATARVPVQATPTSIAYVTNAQWAEPPARLFSRLVSDTVAARTGLVVLSTAQSVGDPGGLLGGELRSFGLDATTREAVVTFDASLTRVGKTTVEKHRFEARVPVSAIDAPSAAAGINQAANQVATQVADWIGR
ncbi:MULTISPECIES: ABC-type transport auxiliary lipoprotein family protein [unclassified Sphingomonas]|jgi:cholesterol transport system auxiliary component|uniref:ABC-type transport auxiliary lipoprotein family protein n=1 Tax=unclassified Sphingomonas TaxID=196159 RepID=UPI000E75A6DF|nr:MULTISPECIES: ABC-type transport auxiliary lipoprotein family protein [unclassified Sphingomonas]RKE53845.1 cholesterol transport system auxiliary component [Sphingomonas sp. PP-CC-1A-547]TCM10388.1 cholesterol transport system auxiliary component [Sphingomonas sp. PP-CC-3G-468]